MNERTKKGAALSHMSATAALAVAALLIVIGWQLVVRFAHGAPSYTATTETTEATTTTNESDPLAELQALVASSSDPVSAASAAALSQLLGAYTELQAEGTSSPQVGTQIASSIGSSLSAPISYKTYTAADITTTSDTSYQGMLAYRAALQSSLKPLMQNKENELNLFAQYVQTGATSSLAQLSSAAENYRLAASSTATVTTPIDAVPIQVNLLNALDEFAATLDSMVAHASDPIASALLLQNYNTAQTDLLTAFQSLANYEKGKQQ